MPEFLLFALYHFSDFFYGRRIYILRTLQRQITNICSTFHTFCIAIGALESLHESGLWRWKQGRRRSHSKRCVAAISDKKHYNTNFGRQKMFFCTQGTMCGTVYGTGSSSME
jgi:hypothetical protein